MSAEDSKEKILADATAMSGSHIFLGILSVLRGTLVARMLTPRLYGFLSIFNLVLLYSRYAPLGITKAAHREVPFYLGKNDQQKADLIQNSSYNFTTILSLGYAAAVSLWGLIFSQEIMIFRKRVLEIDDFNYVSVGAFKEKVRDFEIDPEDIEFPTVIVEVTLADMDDNQEAVVGDWFSNQELTEARITYQFAPAANYDCVGWIEKQRKIIKERQDAGGTEPYLIDFPIGDYRYSIFGGNDPSNECDTYFLKMFKMEFLDALSKGGRSCRMCKKN